jgi:hypothetical protein
MKKRKIEDLTLDVEQEQAEAWGHGSHQQMMLMSG